MNKLNRKEFKVLLTEWRQNFVNERVTPDLIKHITAPKQPFAIIQVNETKPKFREKLKEKNISFGFVGNIILHCEKEDKIKDFINNNFTLNKYSKALLESSYKKEEPILVSSLNYSGDFAEGGQSHSKEECLNWAIHDLFHAFFDHGSFGLYGFINSIDAATKNTYIEKYKTLLTSLAEENKEKSDSDMPDVDLDNLMDHGEEFTLDAYDYKQERQHEHIIPEIVAYFKSINFTDGIESFDLVPSVFSYCLIKMPDPDDLKSLKIMLDTTRLSDNAKMHLLIFNVATKEIFPEMIEWMGNGIYFLDLN